MAKDERSLRFGQRLRELREQKGLTRKQLADSMSLSERAVIQWELGDREPGWFNVLALAAALGVGVEAFAVAPKEPAPPRPRGRPKKDAGQASGEKAKGKGSKTRRSKQ